MADPNADSPETDDESTISAKKKIAAQRASSLAANRKEKNASKAKSASDFVKYSRATIEFQILALQSQLDFITELSSMSDVDKLNTLFDLLDKDGDAKIDARELAEGLRRVNCDVQFEESLERAIAAVATFDADEDAKLDKEEFHRFLDSILENIGGTFDDVVELLVMQVLFSDSGNSPLENLVGEAVKEEIDESVKAAEDYKRALLDDRMMALFKLFDLNDDGNVDFKEVSLGLFKITENMEESNKAALVALLMFDEESSRTLDYPAFTQLILNIVAASPEDVRFEDVADELTRAMVQPSTITEEDLAKLIVADEMQKALVEVMEAEKEICEVIDVVEYGRMQRLFDLWDMNHDGSIDFGELVLGMRKFQDAKSLGETVEESVATMLTFDENDDQKLDRVEFAVFLAKFAKASAVDLHELVDFMVVTSALKDNDEAERNYIESIGAKAADEIKGIEDSLNKP